MHFGSALPRVLCATFALTALQTVAARAACATARPLETFYENAGASDRSGVETLLKWLPLRAATLQLAYTDSHFKYDHANYNGQQYEATGYPTRRSTRRSWTPSTALRDTSPSARAANCGAAGSKCSSPDATSPESTTSPAPSPIPTATRTSRRRPQRSTAASRCALIY